MTITRMIARIAKAVSSLYNPMIISISIQEAVWLKTIV